MPAAFDRSHTVCDLSNAAISYDLERTLKARL